VIDPAPHQAAPAGATSPAAGYTERLRTPLWWYVASIPVAVLLGAEFIFVIPDSLAWLPVVLSILAGIGIVWRMSSGTVRVAAGTLTAGDRSIPVADIAEFHRLTATELRRVVGRHGDPLAYNFIRSWVGPGVQLVLAPQPEPEPEPPVEDGAEPGPLPRLREPYWLLSSRHPDQLLAALRTEVDRTGQA
jgi:hypothetical protein